MNLNLIDIDFLETMGMNASTQNQKKPPPTQKMPDKNIANDPNAILAKLNDKSNQFISAYNVYAMNTREQ